MHSKVYAYDLFIIVVSCMMLMGINEAAAEQLWGGKVFRALEGDALIEAKKGIIAHEYTENPAAFDDADIDYATVVDDTVIVCYDERVETKWGNIVKAGIALYNANGQFVEGHKVVFDKRNGVYGVTLADGELLYYHSSYNCIYKLNKEMIDYYYAPPEDTGYLHSYMTDSYYRIQYDRFHVDITDQFGNTRRMIDHTEKQPLKEYEKSRNLTTVQIISFFMVIVFAACIVLKAYKNR